MGVAAGLTAAGVALAGLVGGRRALAVAVPLAGAVWVYDTVAKNTAAGPAVMAACRGLDVLLGASSGRMRRAVVPALTVAAHTYTVTALSRKEVSGTEPLVPLATLAGTAGVAVATGAPGRGWWHRLLAGWYASGFGMAQVRAVASPDAGTVRAAVGAGIMSLPALQGALIARAGAPVTGVAVAAAAPVGRRLAKRLSPT